MTEIFVGIDPGTYASGVCVLDTSRRRVLLAFHDKNVFIPYRLQGFLSKAGIDRFTTTLEKMRKYGVGAGETVFTTCIWQGRFIQWLQTKYKSKCFSVSSPEIKLCFLGTTRGVSKTAVKHAILESFPKDGGGKTPEIGTKKDPGSLFEMKSATGYHHWDALATSMTVIAWQKGRFDGIIVEEPYLTTPGVPE
jgi:hypothetical protein